MKLLICAEAVGFRDAGRTVLPFCREQEVATQGREPEVLGAGLALQELQALWSQWPDRTDL